MSILSYPNRGPWGDSKYRGNSSGYIYKDLYEALKPKFIIDPCMGSGTSIEVAREMGIEALGLDLHSGFNLLKDSILLASGKPADLVVSHFPYHDMITYSGIMYDQVFKDDLSRCIDVEDFLQKSQEALLNQRDATLPGGFYATLIGDQRKNGKYYSYQAEFIARMPASELKGVLIKAQHNCVSDKRSYSNIGRGLPRITHEYLIVWEKPRITQVSVLGTLSLIAKEAQTRIRSTWKSIVRQAMVSLGGQASLSELYSKISGVARDKIESNKNWQAKIRQVLQLNSCFDQVGRGFWRLA